MDHEHTRGFEQIENKLLVGSASHVFNMDHQVESRVRKSTTQTVDPGYSLHSVIAPGADLLGELANGTLIAQQCRFDRVLRGRGRTETTTCEFQSCGFKITSFR